MIKIIGEQMLKKETLQNDFQCCPFLTGCKAMHTNSATCNVLLPDDGCYLYRWFRLRSEVLEERKAKMGDTN